MPMFMKDIFTANADYNKSAFLNWRTAKHADIENIMVLAEGFLNSSIELAAICLTNNLDKKADILIFPIITNANHGIELYLKALAWTLNILTKSMNKIEGGHNIKFIYESVQSKILEYKGKNSLDHFNEQTEELREYINELFILIKASSKQTNMDFSKYPLSNKFQNQFYVDCLNNVEVDLENFIHRFSNIKEVLNERASYFFYQELNNEW